ncbi:hypothetical protein KDA_61550 [Dictyobacter alpinus]|uniref:Uncharacterized protein n=1 Tax=Dictyobacter alpinus TaxID=2014873 RepID=A0A402BGY2_9CHLR|nr:hypothetical protein [Dictyobacter alpinus]GCE30671.1 hypothetical protein KDA_61550 [Dictyobacter alpinus]
MTVENIDALVSILKTAGAYLILISGVLLFFMGPRIVYHVVHTTKENYGSKILFIRWGHLFVLEIIAGIFCYSALSILGWLTFIPLLQAGSIILGGALLISCLLSNYI